MNKNEQDKKEEDQEDEEEVEPYNFEDGNDLAVGNIKQSKRKPKIVSLTKVAQKPKPNDASYPKPNQDPKKPP